MNNFYKILLISILFYNCKPKEIVTFYDKNNKHVYERYSTNHLGEKNGIYYSFDFQGNLIVESIYKKGKLDGEFKTYCRNKNIFEIRNYILGNLNGPTLGYYCDGRIKYIVNYKNNTMVSVTKMVSKSGENLEIGSFNNGNGILFKYDDNSNLIEKISYKKGLREGPTYLISNTGHIDSIFFSFGKSEFSDQFIYIY